MSSTSNLDPENGPGPHYYWDDKLNRWRRKAGTHSGAIDFVRKAVSERKKKIDNGEYVEPTTQNSFYYYLRTIFLANGINPEIEGTKFRKTITNSISDRCRELETTREDLLIIADVRATLYHMNEKYHVSLKNIKEKKLYLKGTDVIIIEKAALCDLLSPLAAKAGIALLDTKGYVVEYAKVLSELTKDNGGHVAMITDFDADGLSMAEDVMDSMPYANVYRIGIDFNTIHELKKMYLDDNELNQNLELKNIEEPYNPGNAMKNLEYVYALKKTGQRPLGKGQKRQMLFENESYVRHKRIEIDSIQRAVGFRKLWEFIINKLKEMFPERNYNRSIEVPEVVYPEVFWQFHKILKTISENILEDKIEEIKASLENFNGTLDDVGDTVQGILEYFNDKINTPTDDNDNLIKLLSAIWILADQFKPETKTK